MQYEMWRINIEFSDKMAKFLKNIFHTTDRRKAPHYESELEDERSESPQSGTTRHLFISRSGRMRQANKKRHSLTLEIYGDVSIWVILDSIQTFPFFLWYRMSIRIISR